MTSGSAVRLFAVVAVAVGGLAALKTLRLVDDVVRLAALETPAYASTGADHGEPEDDHDAHVADDAEDHSDADAADDAHAPAPSAPAAESCPPPSIADRAGLSHSEIRVLQSLSARRREIETREAEMETRARLLEVAESRLDERVGELTALRDEVESLLGALDQREEQDMSRLVALYERMEPRAAAPILITLSDDILIAVAARMAENKLAAILAEMPTEEAARLTMLLATRHESADEFEARFAAASADGG